MTEAETPNIRGVHDQTDGQLTAAEKRAEAAEAERDRLRKECESLRHWGQGYVDSTHEYFYAKKAAQAELASVRERLAGAIELLETIVEEGIDRPVIERFLAHPTEEA